MQLTMYSILKKLTGAVLLAMIPTKMVVAALPVHSDDWMMRIADAIQQVSYEGEVVHSSNGKMMTYTVSHHAKDAISMQRISAMGEGGREIIRDAEQVACYLPDKKMGVRASRKTFQPLLMDHDLNKLKAHYRVEVGLRAEVAARPCQEIEIIPLDKYRYGYLWCVDLVQFFPLKSELRQYESGRAVPLESQMFMQIQFMSANQEMAGLSAKTADATLNWQQEEDMPDDAPGAQVNMDQISTDVPQVTAHGFELIHALDRSSPGLQKNVKHWVYSDGLARVSVFLIPMDATAPKSERFDWPMGAINTAARIQGDMKVLVMGEVPMQTAKAIAENIHEI